MKKANIKQSEEGILLLDKVSSVKRYIDKIIEESRPINSLQDDLRRDSIILNVLLAFETCINIANHIIVSVNLGVPNSAMDSFDLLWKNKIIDEDLCEKMKMMINFRNMAVHNYEKINIDIVISIIKDRLNDLLRFAKVVAEQKDEIRVKSIIKQIKFDDSRAVNDFEKSQVAEAMFTVYRYYQDTKNQTSSFLNMWRRAKLIGAATAYNSKFYRLCLTSLMLFFEKENNISKGNDTLNSLKKDFQEVSDKDFEEYFEVIIR